jgi:hypothetical protein
MKKPPHANPHHTQIPHRSPLANFMGIPPGTAMFD